MAACLRRLSNSGRRKALVSAPNSFHNRCFPRISQEEKKNGRSDDEIAVWIERIAVETEVAQGRKSRGVLETLVTIRPTRKLKKGRCFPGSRLRQIRRSSKKPATKGARKGTNPFTGEAMMFQGQGRARKIVRARPGLKAAKRRGCKKQRVRGVKAKGSLRGPLLLFGSTRMDKRANGVKRPSA